jgi:hypothetical protein
MTTAKQRKSQLPKLKSHEEEARFWDTHNFSDYIKKFTPVKGIFAKNLSQGSVVQQTAGMMGEKP